MFKPLFTTLATSAHTSGKPTTSQDLIWHLIKEANSAVIKNNINCQHEAVVAACAKAQAESKDNKGKGKEKCHCNNCDKDGHTNNQCFEEGGGMAGKAPDWWLKKHKGKGKDKAKSANAAKTEKNDKNYAFLIFLTIDTPSNSTGDNVALTVMSGHSHEAHTASPSAGVIINCGASSHFSLFHDKFLNYQEISPESVHATLHWLTVKAFTDSSPLSLVAQDYSMNYLQIMLFEPGALFDAATITHLLGMLPTIYLHICKIGKFNSTHTNGTLATLVVDDQIT
ncbi:hypothetical protein C0995_010767 [Termitomyces sp. Mi166|nr:hypothetical protein C0995_010767 [Termitomyces sp. Mi166\